MKGNIRNYTCSNKLFIPAEFLYKNKQYLLKNNRNHFLIFCKNLNRVYFKSKWWSKSAWLQSKIKVYLVQHQLYTFFYASNVCIPYLNNRIGICSVTRYIVSVRVLQWKLDMVKYNQQQITSAKKKNNHFYFQSGKNPGYSRCHPEGYRLRTV